MFRKELEKRLGFKISNNLLKDILAMATDDIKFNRISFGKKTTFVQAVNITVSCAKALFEAN